MVFETFVKEFTYIQKRYFKNTSTLTKGSQNAIVKIGGEAKLSKPEGPMSSKTVRVLDLELSSFSYFNNKINW